MAKSIADSLDLLDSSIADIKSSLSDKDVSTPSSLKVSEVASYIDKIVDSSQATLNSGSRVNSKLSSIINETGATKIVFTNRKPTTSNLEYFNDDFSIVGWTESDTIYISAYGKTIYGAEDCSSMFKDLTTITSIDLTYFDSSNVTKMNYMFQNTSALTEVIGLSTLNVKKVTSVISMFSSSNLTTIDLSEWQTDSFSQAYYMFKDCNATTIDISNFKISGDCDVDTMFSGCSNLQTIYCWNNWDTKAFESKNSSWEVFTDCTNLIGYSIKSTHGAERCKPIKEGGFFTPKADNDHRYLSKDKLKSEWNKSGITALIFTRDTPPSNKTLTDVSIDGDGSVVGWTDGSTYYVSAYGSDIICTDMHSFVGLGSYLESVDFSALDTSQSTDFSEMFINAYRLTKIDLNNIDISNGTNFSLMFQACTGLTTIYCNHDWTQINSNVSTASNIFRNNSKLPNPGKSSERTGKFCKSIEDGGNFTKTI